MEIKRRSIVERIQNVQETVVNMKNVDKLKKAIAHLAREAEECEFYASFGDVDKRQVYKDLAAAARAQAKRFWQIMYQDYLDREIFGHA